jgi:brefeldin A-inhibited guanine nucleotide-exchange protein
LGAIAGVVTATGEGEGGIEFDQLGDLPITTQHLAPYTSHQLREINSLKGDPKLLKNKALKLLVDGILRPLVQWLEPEAEKEIIEEALESDDVEQFSHQKLQKVALVDGIKLFNIKYKKGIKLLLETGCIPSNSPLDVATFLFKTDGLDKGRIGEFLGEGYFTLS